MSFTRMCKLYIYIIIVEGICVQIHCQFLKCSSASYLHLRQSCLQWNENPRMGYKYNHGWNFAPANDVIVLPNLQKLESLKIHFHGFGLLDRPLLWL